MKFVFRFVFLFLFLPLAANAQPAPAASTVQIWDTVRKAGVTSAGELKVSGTFAGGATETTLSSFRTDFLARTNTLGQKLMSASVPVVISSNQTPIDVNIVAGGGGSGGVVDQGLGGASPWLVNGTVAATQSGNWLCRTQDGVGNSIGSTGGALDVNIASGSSSGTEYTEGATDASITGPAVMMEVAADTLRPLQGTIADGLLVNLGANNDVTVTGSVTANAGTNLNTSALALESTLALIKAKTDNIDVALSTRTKPADQQHVIIDSGGGSGTQYTEGDTDASITGTAAMMEVAANTLQPFQGTIADGLLVNLGANNDVTVTGSVTANAGTNLNTSALALESTLALIKAKTDNIDVALSTRTKPADAQHAIIDSGTVAATQSGTWSSRTQDGAGNALTSTAGALDVNIASGASSGQQYTEGDTDASITGTAAMMEVASNVLQPFQGTIVDGLLVNLGANNDVTVTGTVTANAGTDLNTSALALESTLALIKAKTDNIDVALSTRTKPADQQHVIIDSGGGSGTQYTEGDTDATITGTAAMMEVASNVLQPFQGTVADGLLVNLGANNDVTVTGAVTANAGTNLNTSALALESGGNLATIAGKDFATSAKQDTQTTSLQLIDDAIVAEDTASADLDKGVRAMAVRKATPANTSNTDGDNEQLQMDSGRLWTSAKVDTALPAGTNNIGDVDVLTVPADPFGLTADAASATGSISAKLRFIASTGIPITGTVTVGSHAVTNAGTFATQVDGAALTALQLIDDIIATLGTTTYTEATTKGAVIGAVRRDADTTLVDTTNEVGPLQMDANGRLKVEVFSGETLPVSGTVTASNTAGDVAHDAADSGNPVKMGGKAINAFPTAVANNDRAQIITDLFGRQIIAHIDPAMQVSKSVNVTTTQTGTDVWTPTSGKRIAVQNVIISSYATTGCRVLLWFGDNADTTYTAGTDQLLVPFSTAPSTTSKPGLVFAPAFPVYCTTADRELHITTDAGCSLDVSVHGYEY